MIIENKYIGLPSIGPTTKRLCKSNFSVLLLLLVVANMAACSIFHTDFDAGQALTLRTNSLETSLHLGKSGTDDVLQVLGKPNGKGRFLLPTDITGRKTWSYFYEKGFFDIEYTSSSRAGKNIFEQAKADKNNINISGKSTRTILFIYFDSSDKYDGYMWFSGTNKISN